MTSEPVPPPPAHEARRRSPVALPALVATFGLAIVLTSRVFSADVAVRLWLVALAGVAARRVLARYDLVPAGAGPDRFDRAAAPRVPPDAAVPRTLTETRRLLGMAGASAGEVHYRVRPVLRAVAAERLATHGLDLDDAAHAGEACQRCGPALWSVVRPDRLPPAERHAPGPDRDAVVALVDALEAL